MLLRGALAEAVYGRVERGGPALPPHQRILKDQADTYCVTRLVDKIAGHIPAVATVSES